MMRARNWLYHTYLLNDMKAEALAPGALTTPEEREIIKSARSVWEYDDRFISPRYGFRGAEDYYDLCSPLTFMPEIRVPTMVIASCDDPWIPVEYYREFNWADNPSLVPLMPPAGRAYRLPCPRQRQAVVRPCGGEIHRPSCYDEGVSLDIQPFRPRFPWWGADLQTLRNHLRRPPGELAPHKSERLEVDLDDGTGDRLVCSLHRPAMPAEVRLLRS